MASGILGSIAGKLAGYIIDPVWSRCQHLFSYKSNIQNLKDDLKELEEKKTEVQHLIDASQRNAEVVKPTVFNWLGKLDEVKKEADVVLDGTSNVGMGCFCWFSGLKSRYLLSKKALKHSAHITKLIANGEFIEVGYIAPPWNMPYKSHEDSESLESRSILRYEVMEALKNDKTGIIGICGMAGIGKTTLVKEIADKLRDDKLFDEVAMATVSRDPNMKHIQDQLADELGLTIFPQASIHARAGRLRSRLINADCKKILVILDDIWKELDLHNLGIPALDEANGLKVLLTSRFPHVCRNMGANIVEVKALSDQEAWYLFKRTAEVSEDIDFNEIALDVARECKGLPLAIVTVGKALKDKRQHAWIDALGQLKKSVVTNISGMHDVVYSSVEWSYNYLESLEAKTLIMLCSLFPEDYSVPLECLVRYGKGLNLFRDSETFAEVRDRVDNLVDDLKGCYLLLAGNADETVKLHDVVRDVCLSSIAAKGEHVHLVRHAGLVDWPENKSFESYSAISLTFDQVIQLPCGLKCERLKLLRLMFLSGTVNLSSDFFQGMNDLRVLEFNVSNLQFQPLQSLIGLQTLILDNCQLDTSISVIVALKGLEILSFYGSTLREIPSEISELNHLKLLDLRYRRGPCLHPSKILSSFEKIEELYLGASVLPFGESSTEKEMEIKYIEEKRSFPRLTSFQLYLDKPDNLGILNHLQLERIVKFHVIICKQRRSTYDYQFRRSLELIDINVKILSEKAIALLLRRTSTLILKVKGLEHLVTKDRDGFVELRKLELLSGDYKYLVAKSLIPSGNGSANSINNGPSKVLKNLESMKLNNLPNFVGICDTDLFPPRFFSQLQELKLCMLNKMRHFWIGPIWPPSLCNLRVLEMEDCGEMEFLFPRCVLKCLVQLQDLKIGKCHKLKAVVDGRGEGNLDEQVREIPQLKHLNLYALEAFKSFVFESTYRPLLNQVSLPALETLQINHVTGVQQLACGSQMARGSLQKCRAIILSGYENLISFTTAESVRFLEDLQQLRITRCPLAVVFDFSGLNITPGEDSVLARLDSLLLVDLGNLANVWQSVPEGLGAFQSLRMIEISNCGGIEYLFPSQVAKMLANLEELTIHYCKSLQEIMGECGGEVFQVFVFHKLRQISLRDLKVFQSFCSRKHYELIFPSLTKLEIMECPQLRKFCYGKLTAPSLRNVVSGKDSALPMDLKALGASSSGPSAEIVEEWLSSLDGKMMHGPVPRAQINELDTFPFPCTFDFPGNVIL